MKNLDQAELRLILIQITKLSSANNLSYLNPKYNDSFSENLIIFLLVKREVSQNMPEKSPMYFYKHSDMIKNKDFEIATAEFLHRVKINKSYKR